MASNFEENIKNSFLKVKEDISQIQEEINKNKEEIKKLKEKLDELIKKIDFLSHKNENKENSKILKLVPQEIKGSSHSLTHSLTQQQPLNILDFSYTLTKTELLIFLTIYQLEETSENISYIDISKKIKISEASIRSYTSSLIKKGAPVIKEKINNRVVTLKIHPKFRNLNLKKQLIDIFYHQDSNQKTLKEPY